MKKIAFLTAVLLVCSFGVAFADYEPGPKTLGTTDSITIQLSSKVEMDYKAETTGLGYTIGAFHTSGTRTYGSSSGDAKIFWIEDISDPTLPDAPSGTASAVWTDWSAL